MKARILLIERNKGVACTLADFQKCEQSIVDMIPMPSISDTLRKTVRGTMNVLPKPAKGERWDSQAIPVRDLPTGAAKGHAIRLNYTDQNGGRPAQHYGNIFITEGGSVWCVGTDELRDAMNAAHVPPITSDTIGKLVTNFSRHHRLVRPCGSVLFPHDLAAQIEGLRDVLKVAGTNTIVYDIETEAAVKDTQRAVASHALQMVNGADCNATGAPTTEYLLTCLQSLLDYRANPTGTSFKPSFVEKRIADIRECLAWTQEARMRYDMEGEALKQAESFAGQLVNDLTLVLNLRDNPDAPIPSDLLERYKTDDDEGNDEGHGGACPF